MKRRMPAAVLSGWKTALLTLFLMTAGNGQETRSTIFGRVTDPQNASVAGATVVVTNTETNTTTTRKSFLNFKAGSNSDTDRT
jgi:hypothetical protein